LPREVPGSIYDNVTRHISGEHRDRDSETCSFARTGLRWYEDESCREGEKSDGGKRCPAHLEPLGVVCAATPKDDHGRIPDSDAHGI
jgi:hypothetical protein